jgi:hypothetical protein
MNPTKKGSNKEKETVVINDARQPVQVSLTHSNPSVSTYIIARCPIP